MSNLIKRNSNFHFFTKYLMETINIFGTQHKKGNIKTFYHGINKNVLFECTSSCIYGPLSTTSSFCVAVNFTNNNNGLILELRPFPSLKYFSCAWLSAYSNESEFFFIGGLEVFTFVNITNANMGCDYRHFVKAISIIDCLANGDFFDDDKTMFNKSSPWNPLPVSVGTKKLNPTDKTLVVKLIKHELKIEKYENLTEYIANLFHHICINKKQITINFTTMNTERMDTWKGYIGYLFLKHMFCHSAYESINFNFINKLYPNLRCIQLFNLSFINSLTLNDILNFLRNNHSTKVNTIKMVLMKSVSSSIISGMDECINFYNAKFKAVNSSIEHKYYTAAGWHGILIRQN
eukprot:311530_1